MDGVALVPRLRAVTEVVRDRGADVVDEGLDAGLCGGEVDEVGGGRGEFGEAGDDDVFGFDLGHAEFVPEAQEEEIDVVIAVVLIQTRGADARSDESLPRDADGDPVRGNDLLPVVQTTIDAGCGGENLLELGSAICGVGGREGEDLVRVGAEVGEVEVDSVKTDAGDLLRVVD